MVKQILILSKSFFFSWFSPCPSCSFHWLWWLILKLFILYGSNNFFYLIHAMTNEKFLSTDQRREKVMNFIIHMNQFLVVSIFMKVKLTMRPIPCDSLPNIIYNIYFINYLLDRYWIIASLSNISLLKLLKRSLPIYPVSSRI